MTSITIAQSRQQNGASSGNMSAPRLGVGRFGTRQIGFRHCNDEIGIIVET